MKLEALLDRIEADELARVCADLVRLCTVNPPGDEMQAAEYVRAYLEPAGFQCEILDHGEGRGSLLARLSPASESRDERPGLAFSGHLDVVPAGQQPWQRDPFAGTIEDGKVWGRGAADMKGGLAAMLVAARRLAEADVSLHGDLVFLASAGEEVNMFGARELAAHPRLGPLQAILISEPTANRLGLAERGVFWTEFTTYGKTAHGSTPELGRNAVLMMVTLLSEFEGLIIPYTPHPVLGKFTRSVNLVQGGVKVNVIPDRTVAQVDMRTVPGQDHARLLHQLEQFVEGLERRVPGLSASVRLINDLPPAETSPDEPVVAQFRQAVAAATGREPEPALVPFATEAAIFVPALGVPTLIYGPGDPALAHQPDEFIEIEQMRIAARAYLAAALRLLG